MKKLIYEVFRSKREGGYFIANIYSDGDIDVPCSPDDSPAYKEICESEIQMLKSEIRIAENTEGMGPWADHFNNLRYPAAYFTLMVVTGEYAPFEGYRIVYHGEGKRWVRTTPDNFIIN